MYRISPLVSMTILGTLCLFETLCSTRWVYLSKPESLALVTLPYMLCGLGIALFPLLRTRTPKPSLRLPFWGKVSLQGLIWLSLAYYFQQLWLHAQQIIAKFPIDFHRADMLAVIEKQVERFLQSEPIYDIIPEIWGGMPPIYLPAFWAVFVPAMALGYDIRWTTVILLGGSMLLIYAPLVSLKRTHIFTLLPLIPLYFLMEAIWTEKTYLLRFTEEGISIFYYLLLGLAIWKRISWLEGIAIGLCLLSRYSFLPWLVVYGIHLFFLRERREFFTVVGISTAMFVFLLWIPFGTERLVFFLGHPGEYQVYAEKLWTKDAIFFQRTLGLAKYFSLDLVALQHRLHLLLTFAAPGILLATFWHKLKRPEPSSHIHHFFLLCSLKLSLVVFYNLIVVPVYYLFYVNTFFSVLILACYIRFQINHYVAKPSTHVTQPRSTTQRE
ncbi:MAG: hypothetical protein AB8H47_00675 [Bacteroidia bacterium]